MDTAALRRFRSRVRQLADGKAPQGVRYPVALRDAAVKLGRARLRQGHSLATTARALRISEPTLAGWLRPRRRARFRPVALAPDPEPTRASPISPVLITAQGVRVEGLDRDTLIVVLRALT